MPFFGHKYYGSHNDMYSVQTQAGEAGRARREGWCAAGSAIWCSNVLLKGLPPEKSKPNLTLAGVLQVKYRWDPAGGGQDVLNLLSLLDLDGELVFNGSRGQMLNHMQADPGVYWFSAHGHAMAGDTRPRKKLWYDIENGLYGYDFVMTMRWDLAIGYPNSEGWRAFRCRVR